MIDDVEIRRAISTLDGMYLANLGNDMAKYYSKLALLEVCGWIEQSVDKMANEYMIAHSTEQKNIDVFKELLKYTNSFEYKESTQHNFRSILLHLLGTICLERMEKTINSTNLEHMKSSLKSLKDLRDPHSHTYVPGTQAQFYAPSWVKAHFENIYICLVDIDSYLAAIVP